MAALTLDQKAQAALDLLPGVEELAGVQRDHPGVYAVPSRSEPGEHRLVTVWPNGAARCTCPRYELKRQACAHLVAALLFLKERVEREEAA